MGTDELWDGRDDDGPAAGPLGAGRSSRLRAPRPLPRPVGAALLVGLCAVLVGLVVHDQGQKQAAARLPDRISNLDELTSVDPEPTLPSDDELPDLMVSALCTARTGADGVLSLSFVLTNPGSRAVPVLDVMPLLPLGGLRPVGRRVTHGDCTHDRGHPLDQLVPSGADLRVTFDFAAPRACPDALPVQAVLRIRRQDHAVDQRLPVFSDLGSVGLPACR